MFDTQNSSPQGSPEQRAQQALGTGIAKLAFEIVDIAGMLTQVDGNSKSVVEKVTGLHSGAQKINGSVEALTRDLDRIEDTTQTSLARAETAITDMKDASQKAQAVAAWVQGLDDRMNPLEQSLKNVQRSAQRIAGIATQVNILAINARIEAARAGEHGRGFAVVAESISELSHQTETVTKAISDEIGGFSESLAVMKDEAQAISTEAEVTLTAARKSDEDMTAIADAMTSTTRDLQQVAGEARIAGDHSARFQPVFAEISGLLQDNAGEIHDGRNRVDGLADAVERLVQINAATGARTDDAVMIDIVTDRARQIAEAFEYAISINQITITDLFDDTYRPIPGTDPQQVDTRFTGLTDRLLPPIQEPVLELDGRIVFCAAVDRNGYLPTHNLKFCNPQGDDPVWNAANCRNRRIFDDRVGLKAGKSTAPFLLQVYRRDMGGGNWVLMKDLSAPITVKGRHWGGLRLAYNPE